MQLKFCVYVCVCARASLCVKWVGSRNQLHSLARQSLQSRQCQIGCGSRSGLIDVHGAILEGEANWGSVL